MFIFKEMYVLWSYIKKVESLAGVPIDIISTGPDRNETIILRDLFSL
jgi:adenylosuccinate synthase